MAEPSTALVTALDEERDRTTFTSGVEPLDRYFRQQAGQDQRRRVAVCYVLIDPREDRVAGFYTLSAYAVVAEGLPPEHRKRLPKYGLIPCTLLGRLAVDRRYRGRGVGSHLLIDALNRSLKQSGHIASWGVVADAKDNAAGAFYQRHGFIVIPATPDRLFIPMRTVEASFR